NEVGSLAGFGVVLEWDAGFLFVGRVDGWASVLDTLSGRLGGRRSDGHGSRGWSLLGFPVGYRVRQVLADIARELRVADAKGRAVIGVDRSEGVARFDERAEHVFLAEEGHSASAPAARIVRRFGHGASFQGRHDGTAHPHSA